MENLSIPMGFKRYRRRMQLLKSAIKRNYLNDVSEHKKKKTISDKPKESSSMKILLNLTFLIREQPKIFKTGTKLQVLCLGETEEMEDRTWVIYKWKNI